MRKITTIELRGAFIALEHAIGKYRGSVSDTLRRYAADVGEVKHVYSKDIAEQKRAALCANARNDISEAALTLGKAATTCADQLEAFLQKQLLPGMPDDAEATLAFYRKYDIRPSLNELQLLARLMDGSYAGLRAVQAYAERHNYAMDVPTIDGYFDEVKRIRNNLRGVVFYAPDDCMEAALEVMPDIPLRRADGTVYGTQGRPTALTMIAGGGMLKGIENICSTGAERWEKLFVSPVVEIRPDVYSTQGEYEAAKAAAEERHNSAVLEQVAGAEIREAQQKQDSNNAAGVLAHYTR